MSACIHCGERDGMHWHGCASRTEDSVCPCASCREPASADGPIDIDALGAEIEAAGKGDPYSPWPGMWARWIRDWPGAAASTRSDNASLLRFLVPFADRIAAAGKQVLAERAAANASRDVRIEPATTFEGPIGACALTPSDMRALVWDVLSHAIGAETPRETVARLAKEARSK